MCWNKFIKISLLLLLMSKFLSDLLNSGDRKRLPEIDLLAKEQDSFIGRSRCSECRHCLIIDGSGFYCSSGDVQRIVEDPVTGIESRMFIPYEEGGSESLFTFPLDELPFPLCHIFNDDGHCTMYEQGSPNKIEIPDDLVNDELSIELQAYQHALKMQKK